jgi:hypothetical protein
MKLHAPEYRKIQFLLRCVAEKHHNDIIANRCSDLAYRMESTPIPVDTENLEEWERQLIRYVVGLKADPQNSAIFAPRESREVTHNGKIFQLYAKRSTIT